MLHKSITSTSGPQGFGDMERVLRIADQDYCIFDAATAPFIPVDIIALAVGGREADSSICFPYIKGKLTYLLLYAAGVQYPVRFQCANGIEALFDKGIHDVAACIPAVTKEIGDNRRHGQFLRNVLYDFHF